MIRRLFILAACMLALYAWAPVVRAQVDTDTPTETPTDTPASTATETSTDTPVPTDTVTETPTDTPTPIATDTPTETAVPTDTATETPTDTPTLVATDTPTDTPVVVVPTDTPTDTPVVVVPTDTPTDTPVVVVPTGTPTDTPVVVVPTDTPTDTPVIPPTDTPTPAATGTPTATRPPTVTYTPTIPVVTGSGVTMRSIVQAQCAGAVSCNSLGITFAKGKVRIQLIRPPSLVGELEVGRIKMNRVFPAQPALEARVVGDITYGADPDGDCPLANTQALGAVYATSRLACHTRGAASDCKGTLALPTLLPAGCTDVGVLVNNAHIQVYDINAPGSPTSLIGRDGLKISSPRQKP